ncbi:FtsK/SpoIIIE domain-containing protein [Fictibacillus phosphorivorans]|uniref:FtsK/SpoIIIE domain-containing protein n=1 Tax=Fictibacillus phosphorivorans TaxID=1221500 RepID=UPI003CEC0867
MLFEILSSSVMASVAGYGYLKRNGITNDATKIQRIFRNCGLVVVEKDREQKIKREVQLYRRSKILNDDKKVVGNEFVYRIPLGLSFGDFEKRIDHIRDGLNNKKQVFDFTALKCLDFKGNVLQQIKEMVKNKKSIQKDVELSYDGMLRVKVYNQPITDYLEYEEMKNSGWKIPIGLDRLGRIVYHDFDSEYYMLIGGAIGGGKSNAANLILSHLLFTQSENIKLSLVDLKDGIEFECYKDCKQVVGYADEPQGVMQVLEDLLKFIEEMKIKVKEKGCRNVIEAGIKERHFLVIDEIAELSPDEETNKELKAAKQEMWATINHIARLGRAWGVRIISATQHPIQECVPKYLKRNSEGRLCFSVEDDVASRVVLGTTGAEKLPEINGRALYKKGAKMKEIQTYRILNETIDKAININLKAREDHALTNENPERRVSALVLKETGLS